MRYNVPLYFERKDIKISDIFIPDRILTHNHYVFLGKKPFDYDPDKRTYALLPEKKDFLNISKGVVLRKNQNCSYNIRREGLLYKPDGAVFQGRKRNLSQHQTNP